MSTQPQVAASQASAPKSAKNGLTGKFVLIAAENPDEFLAYMQEYFSQHNPATIDEQFLVRQMAEAMWRLRRIQRLELFLFDHAPLANPFADSNHSNELLKLTRYQKSLESSYFRASRELRTIRKERTETVKKEEKQEIDIVEEEKKQKIAEFSAALDEIMYGPLPGGQDIYEIGPDGRPAARNQSKGQKS